jgi:hypothetical protein
MNRRELISLLGGAAMAAPFIEVVGRFWYTQGYKSGVRFP